ncbi:MAG: winged helix-turn-helix domain-containing protein [Euryarchaeota archaeon]|nr:winged helix-turn-helix domain-containing protein [Euryarchaeota archaeon]
MVSNANNNGMEENTEDEKLLILPLNDKNSKKLSQIISNDTARNILEAIASQSLSASQIAEKLGIPLSTVQYNLDKLSDAGLVKVERTKYSEKGKEVKIYAPQRKFVVIVPEKTNRKDVIATLKRYLAMIAFAVVGSGIIEFLAIKMKGPIGEVTRSIPEKGLPVIPSPTPMSVPSPMPTPMPMAPPEGILDIDTALGFDFFAHPGLWFLFGALFVILAVFVIDYLSRKKERKD